MTTDGLPKVLLNYKPRGYRNIGDPWLDGKTHSVKVGNRPAAYILDVEEEEEMLLGKIIEMSFIMD
jgi:hypothetical protein